jgi:transcriptional regulator with XRE-family HTH domain
MILCMSLTELGHTIRRGLAGRSQVWLSQQSGVDQSTISRILNGKVVPTPETLESLGKALGLDPAHLMRLAGLPIPTGEYDPEAAYIAQRLTELPPGLREQAVDALGAQLDTIYKVAGMPSSHQKKRERDPKEEEAELVAELEEIFRRLRDLHPEVASRVVEMLNDKLPATDADTEPDSPESQRRAS